MVAWSPEAEEAPTVRLPAARTARVTLLLALCAALLVASGASAAPRPHGHWELAPHGLATSFADGASALTAAPARPSPDSAHRSRPPAPPRMSRVRKAELRSAAQTPDSACDLSGTVGADPAALQVDGEPRTLCTAALATLASKASRTRGQPERA